MDEKEKYMKLALRLARKGAGWVNPNPMVGAVVVKDGVIVGKGYHEFFGGPHAEVNALMMAGEKARGADLYVNLEPCSHHGKTPPCTDLILSSEIKRVFYAIGDPNPKVSGGGARTLRSRGVVVEPGILAHEASVLNEVFLKFSNGSNPFVVLKTAMTLDGKAATVTNASRWITGEQSRALVHRLRHELSAVMVGADTVIYDNPLLNVRTAVRQKRNPLKVIVDSTLRIPADSKVLTNDPQLTIVACTSAAKTETLQSLKRLGVQVIVCPEAEGRVDLRFLMQALGLMEIDSVMIEGGGTLAFSALKSGIVDKVVTFVAPKILGGKEAPAPVGGEGFPAMEDALQISQWKMRKIGPDFLVEGYLKSTTQKTE